MPAFFVSLLLNHLNMEEVKTGSPGITKDVTNLVDTYIALAKANVTQKAADAVSVSISGFIMAVLAVFAVFFAGAGLAWWIGRLLSNMIAGFFIVSGLFVLLLVLLVAFKEQFLYPIIRNRIVKKVYE